MTQLWLGSEAKAFGPRNSGASPSAHRFLQIALLPLALVLVVPVCGGVALAGMEVMKLMQPQEEEAVATVPPEVSSVVAPLALADPQTRRMRPILFGSLSRPPL